MASDRGCAAVDRLEHLTNQAWGWPTIVGAAIRRALTLKPVPPWPLWGLCERECGSRGNAGTLGTLSKVGLGIGLWLT